MQSQKRQKKEAITGALSEKLARAKSIVITDYRGLNTAQLNELRQKLASASAEYQIAKNTLVKRALTARKIKTDDTALSGPTALLYSYEDEVAAIKVLAQFAKTTKLPEIKGGYLGTDLLSAQQVDALATLPAREALLGQVVGTMNAPITNFVGVLNANLTSLLYVLNAIKDKQ